MTTRTSKATEAAAVVNRRRRQERLARELREGGWICLKAGEISSDLPLDAEVYATNQGGETHRVKGWTADHKPILDGRYGPYEGLLDYAFTIGWRARETARER